MRGREGEGQKERWGEGRGDRLIWYFKRIIESTTGTPTSRTTPSPPASFLYPSLRPSSSKNMLKGSTRSTSYPLSPLTLSPFLLISFSLWLLVPSSLLSLSLSLSLLLFLFSNVLIRSYFCTIYKGVADWGSGPMQTTLQQVGR